MLVIVLPALVVLGVLLPLAHERWRRAPFPPQVAPELACPFCGHGMRHGGSCTPALPSGGNRATHHAPVCGWRCPAHTRCVGPGRCSPPGSRRPGCEGRACATPARPSCSTRGR